MSGRHRSDDQIFLHNRQYYIEDLNQFQTKRIRILGINPGQFHDPLVLRLRSVPLRSNLAYGALSYAWGQRGDWEDITVNGQPGFKITPSVAGALRRLRHTERTRCLWVDAICINQANVKERSAQVALMTDIFKFAELVYVWLGPCGGTVDKVGELEVCNHHRVDWDGTVNFIPGMQHNLAPLCIVQETGKLQWFWRTWAVQEMALAKKIAVLIGPHHMSWQKALEGFEESWIKTMPGESAHRTAYQQLMLFNTVRGKRNWLCGHLRYLLSLTATHAATDPRDKVYGILGLLECSGEEVMILPDYSKTFEEVCREATLYLLKSEQALDILMEDWPRLGNPYPTWAINFAGDARTPRSLLQRGEINYFDAPQDLDNTRRCCASGASKPCLELEDDHLIVRGVLFGVIVLTAHGHPEDLGRFHVEPARDLKAPSPNIAKTNGFIDPEQPRAQALDWLERNLADGEPAAYHQDFLDTQEQFARTITADWFLRTEQSRTDDPSHFSIHASAFQVHKRKNLFEESAWHVLRDRAFFKTEHGFCGVGCPEAEVGDVVAVLVGCSVPALLRRMTDSDAFALVGECYISGIMYGELLRHADAYGGVQRIRLA